MPTASEIEPVARDLWIWRAYDPGVKAELFSTAIAAGTGLYLIDPIDLAPDALSDLRASGRIQGIVVTNENHQRAATALADTFKVPIYADGAQSFPSDLTSIQIEGAAPGEIAVHSVIGSGVLVIGDALINFEPYGFTFLPPKYCTHPKLMRRSLAKLLDYSFESILFAHGTPILSGARQRLEELLRR